MKITFGRAIQAPARCILGPNRFCTTILRTEAGEEHMTVCGRRTCTGSTEPAHTLHLASWKAEVEFLFYYK